MSKDDFAIKLKELSLKLGFTIHDEILFREAFTHPSYANENKGEHYDRLEFLGDAILDFIVSEYLYNHFKLAEGEMTKIRAKFVCASANVEYSRELGLPELILLGHGAQEHNESSHAVIADVFESFLGALYLDQGLERVRTLIQKVVLPKINVQKVDFFIDYKSKLQEYVQAESRQGVIYTLIEEVGPPHDKTFTTSVNHDGIILGTGQGKSKKEAEQNAAKDALQKVAR
ncbi:MAG: ribonuclease III [Bacilli bacterium]|nr:ribonuclease III [Bacilli bacterium]